MAVWKIDYELLYASLDGQRQRKGCSWRQVAADMGIPPGTFTRLKSGKGVADDTFATMVQWLDNETSIMPFLAPGGQSRALFGVPGQEEIPVNGAVEAEA